MRVLLSAYACEPGRGSEPGVGWNWVRHLGRDHDVWLLTRRNNQAAVERGLAAEGLTRVRLACVDLPAWARFWKKGSRGIRLYYYLWQVAAYLEARRLQREVSFDVVHHVTFVKYWMPSLVALLPVPFVWGPVGGGESTPAAFRPSLSLRGRAYEWARDRARAIGERDPLVRLTARRAAIAFATTPDSAARLAAIGCRRVRVWSEAGLSRGDLAALIEMPIETAPGLRVLSIGNLLHLKGFELGLRAFARFLEGGGQGTYDLLGDGPERQRLEALCDTLGIRPHVRFHGQIPRAEVLTRLRDGDLLLHPSLHDSGGWVCLEAMAAGRPVVCLDLGGPATQVTPDTGIVVPATTPGQAVADIAAALTRLQHDHSLRTAMGDAGRRHVLETYAWDVRAVVMSGVYRDVVGEEQACTSAA